MLVTDRNYACPNVKCGHRLHVRPLVALLGGRRAAHPVTKRKLGEVVPRSPPLALGPDRALGDQVLHREPHRLRIRAQRLGDLLPAMVRIQSGVFIGRSGWGPELVSAFESISGGNTRSGFGTIGSIFGGGAGLSDEGSELSLEPVDIATLSFVTLGRVSTNTLHQRLPT